MTAVYHAGGDGGGGEGGDGETQRLSLQATGRTYSGRRAWEELKWEKGKFRMKNFMLEAKRALQSRKRTNDTHERDTLVFYILTFCPVILKSLLGMVPSKSKKKGDWLLHKTSFRPIYPQPKHLRSMYVNTEKKISDHFYTKAQFFNVIFGSNRQNSKTYF
jgi:hypothetical protein